MTKPLLMIPGPIEISDAVFAATQIRPASHVAPDFKRSFHLALHAMRTVWGADASYTPFVVSGSGTLAMESAATNLVQRGEPVLVINTGYFGDRMAEMLRRRGAKVFQVGAQLGERVDLDEVRLALRDHKPVAMFATHVDTSTGVCEDVRSLAKLAAEAGCLSIFDGVCATAAEDFSQLSYGADVYFTASQKAIGLPPGLALWMASPAAMERRAALTELPPMTLDWAQWAPIMEAYLEERNAYFSTPATTLIPALQTSLDNLVSETMPAVFSRHQRAKDSMQNGFRALGLTLVATDPARTLSAVYWPQDVGVEALPRIKAHGAIVAGGLHPAIKAQYFRVGHMGDVTHRRSDLRRTFEAVARGLIDAGARLDLKAGLAAFESEW